MKNKLNIINKINEMIEKNFHKSACGEKAKVLLTGATGTMGSCGLEQMLAAGYEVTAFSLDTKRDRRVLNRYSKFSNMKVFFGDLTDYQNVYDAIKNVDIVLHVGAFVSPEADYHPQRAMDINYNSTMNIINAIKAQGRADTVKLVYIGTIAETGDRLPPIQWGRVGDPIKPSVFDYYAVSKVAAERAVIESGLKYWVSLRQTGIMSKKMMEISDGIIFHNCLDNVLEFVSDRDSGTLLKNVCGDLPNEFWGHIYNIGGGESCRITSFELMSRVFALVGVDDLSLAVDAKWFATRNFHGQSYLDSDKLNDYLHFRSDSIDYMIDIERKKFGILCGISKTLCKIKPFKKLISKLIGKVFEKQIYTAHGTMNFIDNNLEDKISAYFISKEDWDEITPLNQMQHFNKWDEVVKID
ncbi:MAG: NAD(P)-dependent oxidoreductase, partial [Clostridia bacterium]